MFEIIKDFAGANIKVNGIDGNTVYLEQEIRDTGEWWFWWNFKCKTDGKETVRFVFENGNVIHKMGVCYRYEDGEFSYDLAARVSGNEFVFSFDKAGVWQFAFSIPYLKKDWEKFLLSLPKKPNVVLVGKSEQGRDLEIIDENPTGEAAVVMTCRHHACESVAAFSMEGAVRHWLESGFTDKYRLIVFPFVDIDGVENGDQGKSRKPHDHNRDYIEAPIYNSVKFLKKTAEEVSVKCLFDMHCPAAYGGTHDHLSLIGLAEPHAEAQNTFSEILFEVVKDMGCPIGYDPKNNIPFGTHWNRGEMPCCSRYFARQGAALAFSFEHPFAGDGEKPYTPDDLRFFGKCFAVAVEEFLARSQKQ